MVKLLILQITCQVLFLHQPLLDVYLDSDEELLIKLKLKYIYILI